jgi:formamidopyrimidine-DNA glycosylase
LTDATAEVPELPEIEVTRLRIAPLLEGRTVSEVHTTRRSPFFLTPPSTLRRRLTGRTIRSVARRGKYLVGALDDASRLVLHLGMTGQLFSSHAASPRLLSATSRAALAPEEQCRFRPDAHTHLRLGFEDGGPEVFFRDARKFGKVLLLGPGQRSERLDRLGTEALELSGQELFRATRGRRLAIKSLLLDQSVVAGSGNIYGDETLFLAGVRPTRRAGRVTRRECDAISEGIKRVMLRSIETGGSSISDFVAPDGRDGGYQDERHVYAREEEPCHRCGRRVRRVVIGQRSAHYCPGCQR